MAKCATTSLRRAQVQYCGGTKLKLEYEKNELLFSRRWRAYKIEIEVLRSVKMCQFFLLDDALI